MKVVISKDLSGKYAVKVTEYSYYMDGIDLNEVGGVINKLANEKGDFEIEDTEIGLNPNESEEIAKEIKNIMAGKVEKRNDKEMAHYNNIYCKTFAYNCLRKYIDYKKEKKEEIITDYKGQYDIGEIYKSIEQSKIEVFIKNILCNNLEFIDNEELDGAEG